MKLRDKKIDPDAIDWAKYEITDDEKILKLKQIILGDLNLNFKFSELAKLGLKQKYIAEIYGVSPSTVSLRKDGKVGKYDTKDVLGNYSGALTEEFKKARKRMPHSDFLIELLELHGISQKKIAKIVYYYTMSPEIYDNRVGFRKLLRAFDIKADKVDMIVSQMYEFESPVLPTQDYTEYELPYPPSEFYRNKTNYY